MEDALWVWPAGSWVELGHTRMTLRWTEMKTRTNRVEREARKRRWIRWRRGRGRGGRSIYKEDEVGWHVVLHEL